MTTHFQKLIDKKLVIISMIMAMIIFFCLALSLRGRNDSMAETKFLDQVCKNMKTYQLDQASSCPASGNVGKVMNVLFPTSTSIHDIRAAMTGIEVSSSFADSLPGCQNYTVINYFIIHRPKVFGFPIVGFDETMEFSFCDGKLNSTTWHN